MSERIRSIQGERTYLRGCKVVGKEVSERISRVGIERENRWQRPLTMSAAGGKKLGSGCCESFFIQWN